VIEMALAEVFESTDRPVLREAADGEDVCQDCQATLVVIDDDGSVSGTVGSVIDCGCVALAVPPGFVECGCCAALVRINGALAARQDELVAEYQAFCVRAGREPAWCLACGDYRPLVNDSRPPCSCSAPAVRLHLGSVTVGAPWGVEG
jgi:hypothetical protein